MALYDYRCINPNCGHLTEMLFKGSDDVLVATNCKKCGGSAKRIIGRFSARFKGSGFYETTYGKHKPHTGYKDTITELGGGE